MNRMIARSVAPLLVGMVLLMLASALQFSLSAVRADTEGFGNAVIALMGTSYFAGFLVGGRMAPRWIGSVGHVRTFSAMASLASVVVLLQAIYVEPALWVVARVASGLCIAAMVTAVEAWLNGATETTNRGTTLSVYMVTMYLGFAGGQMLVGASDPAGFMLFAVVSILLSVSLVPVLLGGVEEQEVDVVRGLGVRTLWQRAPVGIAATLWGGLAWGVIAPMLIVVGLREGFDSGEAASIGAAAILGAVLSQIPLGRLSDRVDRRIVILISGLGSVVVGLAAMSMITSGRLPLLWIGAAGLGALSLPAYALGLAHVGDVLEPEETVAAAGTLVTLSSAGSAVGPLVAGAALALMGSPGVPLMFTVCGGALAGFTAWRLTRQKAPESQGHFVPLGARTTAFGTAVVAEEFVGEDVPVTVNTGTSSD